MIALEAEGIGVRRAVLNRLGIGLGSRVRVRVRVRVTLTLTLTVTLNRLIDEEQAELGDGGYVSRLSKVRVRASVRVRGRGRGRGS